MRRKNSERQPLPMMPKVIGVEVTRGVILLDNGRWAGNLYPCARLPMR